MKAVCIEKPWSVGVKEVERVEPNYEESVIKVHAAGICGSDIGAFRGTNNIVSYPRIIGHEIAGEVISVGTKNPNNIKVGGSAERYRSRLELQARAADRCNALCAMIEIAKPLFHLPSKRATYWIGQTVEVRNQIRAWRESDMKRLKPSGETPVI